MIEWKANYRKKLNLFLYGHDERGGLLIQDAEKEGIIVEKYLHEKKKLMSDEEKFKTLETKAKTTIEEQAIKKAFPGVSGTAVLKYTKCITVIHSLRKVLGKFDIIGAVGGHNSGKSTFLQMAFGIDTKPGVELDNRTIGIQVHPIPNCSLLVIDFPGTDEVVIDKRASLVMESTTCLIVISTMNVGLNEYTAGLVTKAQQYKVPHLLCFNQADVFWDDIKGETDDEVDAKFFDQANKMLAEYKAQSTSEMCFTIFTPKYEEVKEVVERNGKNLVLDINGVKEWLARKVHPLDEDKRKEFMESKGSFTPLPKRANRRFK